ncbi:DUF2252 family protein [Salinisphaera hydrothermalis]|uniref:DUF2252 family protein n=1 Tax=Salinisphaera hydrothermalis TaxID=563188 RepID=UPI0033428EF1
MAGHGERPSREERVIDAIDIQNRDLRDIDRHRKYAKMARSPYRFFRGTNHLFWADVAHDWRIDLYGGAPDTRTWLQGDAHVHNHGAYGDDRQGVHFGMDDFDDAFVGDYQYDLWRHAASMMLDAEENAGLPRDKARRAIRHFVTSYLDTLAEGRLAEEIHVAYEDPPLDHFMAKVLKKRGVNRQLDKWTVPGDDGERVFDTEYRTLGGVSAAERAQLHKAMTEQYPTTLVADADGLRREPRVVDIARRIDAGTGSLGADRFYALAREQAHDADDYLILDIKQQTEPPALAVFDEARVHNRNEEFEHEGDRHAAAARALSQHPDAYIGWLSLGDAWFSVKRRSPYKKDFPTHKIGGFKAYRNLTRQWGRILAREHLRGAAYLEPDNPARFARTIGERIGTERETFKRLIVEFAEIYAERTRHDYAAFMAQRAPDDQTASA